MRGRRAGIAAATAVGVTAAALAAGIAPAGAAGTRSSSDPVGDAGTALDITFLTVSNDDTGKITFRIAVPALTAAPAATPLSIVLNTDLKLTGQSGIDYVITSNGVLSLMAAASPSGQSSPLFAPRSLSTSFEPGFVTVSINRRDLGGTRAFVPAILSLVLLPDGTIDPNEANSDLAPVDAGWTYTLKLPTKLLVRSANLSPGRPAAGGSFRAGVFVRDVTFGAPGDAASGGKVTCAFRIAGAKVTARGSITPAGRATCSGAVPATATGKLLAGTVTYRLKGAVVKRTFSSTVG